MRTENNIIYISIGGVEYPVRVLYKDVENFFKGFDKILRNSKGKPKVKIPNKFFFGVLWKCLVKDGYLMFKKPFRSKRHMINSLLYTEIPEITTFVSKHVLKFEDDAADPESKKKQDHQ